jgi:DNA (cytosine-5)-methyltransferase 1
VNELSLFTGAGGGILGTHLLGWRPIGYVEWDDYCQRVLAARIADGLIPSAPIFGDVREFVQSGAAEQYRGFADVVTAGFPCQPFSAAGKHGGADDERNMWPAACEVIRAVQPQSVFLENSPNLISRGYIGVVISDLAEMGFVGRWGIVSARDAGFRHLRKRAWIVAHAKRSEWWKESHDGKGGRVGRFLKPFAWDRDWLDVFTGVRGTGDGVADRVGRTDAIRNGQVPRVAAAAWELLA